MRRVTRQRRMQNKPAKRGRGGNVRVSVSLIADRPTNALGLIDKGA
jgi:hypothetical protein